MLLRRLGFSQKPRLHSRDEKISMRKFLFYKAQEPVERTDFFGDWGKEHKKLTNFRSEWILTDGDQ